MIRAIQCGALTVLICGLVAVSPSAANFVSNFDASGDGWAEVSGSDFEYGYDLNKHGAIPIASGTVGARFNGVGNLNRGGLALPAAGQTASWYAKMGPWHGDSFLFAGIGDGGGGVPSEYAFTYNADTDDVSIRVGGSIVAEGKVSGKIHGLYSIDLANVGGTITADMSMTNLTNNTVLLSASGTRPYSSATMSSQLVSDWGGKKIFVDEVGYNVVPEPGTLVLLGISGMYCFCRRRRG